MILDLMGLEQKSRKTTASKLGVIGIFSKIHLHGQVKTQKTQSIRAGRRDRGTGVLLSCSLLATRLAYLLAIYYVGMKTKPDDDESPAPERDQKRPRLTASAEDAPPPPPPLGPLPAELWADVIDSLDLGEMICACLISRSFLREVIPRVTEIEVDHADQMRAFVGRRFSGVTVLRIGCLFEYYDYEHCQRHGRNVFTVNDDAINRSSPFLSNFVGLENISFLGTAFLASFAGQDDAADLIPEGIVETMYLRARDQVVSKPS